MTIKNYTPIDDDDFGFSAISAADYEAKIAQAAEPAEEYKQRLEIGRAHV